MVKKNAEKFNRLSRVHERHRRQTDQTTDRQTTDDRRQTNILRSAKNEWQKLLWEVADTEGEVVMPPPPLEAHVSTLPLQKFV